MAQQSNSAILQPKARVIATSLFKVALQDFQAGIKQKHIFLTLGWQDIATRYRRSRVGAFWLTLNMAVLIATLGIIFGSLFGTPIAEFLPSVTIGIVVWGLLSATISEGCESFISARDTILQVKMPLSIHIFRVITRNVLIFGHNALIIPLVFIILTKPVGLVAFYSILGMVLLILNSMWMVFFLSIICTRFRDVTEIIKNIMQVMFYVTPIIWGVGMLPQKVGAAVLNFNPFYHLLCVVREPLMGQAPTIFNWSVVVLMAVIGWTIALAFFNYYHKRVVYWL